MSESGTSTTTKTYRGNCHCGAFIFELTCPEITTGFECNCSICYKKGVTWTFPGEGSEFKLVKGEEKDLQDYTFGKGKIHNKFCGTCGTSLYGISPDRPAGTNRAVNTRAIQDLKIWDLIINSFDGASIDPKYEPPVFKGEEPAAEVEGGKIYHGSCHCGAVQVALKSKPLDETFPGPIMECNCSIDQRAGAIWTYPHKSQVSITGADNLKEYKFGRFDWSIFFCKICGIPVVRKSLPKTDEELAAMNERRRTFLIEKKDNTPINLRVLNGFEISNSGLKITKGDGWNNLQPGYVNP